MSSLKETLRNFRRQVISLLLRDIQDTQAQTLQELHNLQHRLDQLLEQLPESAKRKYVDTQLFRVEGLAKPQQRKINKAMIRQRCQSAYVGEGVALCRVLGKYRLYVNAAEAGLAGHLMLNGFWEMSLTELIVQTIQPGMVAIDVGANFGYFTTLLADLCGKQGKVYSFEPNPQVHRLLSKSLKANGYESQVALYQKAVTDREDLELNFYIPKDFSGHATLVDPEFVPTSTEAFRFETVSSVTLDQVVGEDVTVDFVKIDAEGAERSVWNGMRQILKRSPQICVALEFGLGRYDGAAAAFLDDILIMGFQLGYLSNDGVKVVTKEELLNETMVGHATLILKREFQANILKSGD